MQVAFIWWQSIGFASPKLIREVLNIDPIFNLKSLQPENHNEKHPIGTHDS